MRQPSNHVHVARHRDNIARFTIEADGTLLAAAAQILKDHKPAKLKSMLRHNQFAVNGTPSSQFNRPVSAGDTLEVNFDRSFQVFSHPKLKLIYEDNDLLVVDKAYGLLSTGTGKEKEETVFSIMRKYVRQRNERAHVYVIHRLDRDTSGLMLLARSTRARDRLLKEWSTLVTERLYEGIVEGVLPQDHDVVKQYLKDDENNYEMQVTNDKSQGKLAVTEYTTLERGQRFSRVLLVMKTGRKNQIRVAMQSLGHPISGDRKYGARPNGIHRLALHATSLTITHPATGNELKFESPAPESFTTQLYL